MRSNICGISARRDESYFICMCMKLRGHGHTVVSWASIVGMRPKRYQRRLLKQVRGEKR